MLVMGIAIPTLAIQLQTVNEQLEADTETAARLRRELTEETEASNTETQSYEDRIASSTQRAKALEQQLRAAERKVTRLQAGNVALAQELAGQQDKVRDVEESALSHVSDMRSSLAQQGHLAGNLQHSLRAKAKVLSGALIELSHKRMSAERLAEILVHQHSSAADIQMAVDQEQGNTEFLRQMASHASDMVLTLQGAMQYQRIAQTILKKQLKQETSQTEHLQKQLAERSNTTEELRSKLRAEAHNAGELEGAVERERRFNKQLEAQLDSSKSNLSSSFRKQVEILQSKVNQNAQLIKKVEEEEGSFQREKAVTKANASKLQMELDHWKQAVGGVSIAEIQANTTRFTQEAENLKEEIRKEREATRGDRLLAEDLRQELRFRQELLQQEHGFRDFRSAPPLAAAAAAAAAAQGEQAAATTASPETIGSAESVAWPVTGPQLRATVTRITGASTHDL